MPILPPEPDRYPADLMAPAATAGAAGTWWVLHTKPRQEKSVARHLLTHQVSFYLPLSSGRQRGRTRAVNAVLPLFPGYLFLHGDREDRLRALTSNRIVRALEVEDASQLWFDLRQIDRLLSSSAPVTPEQQLAPGTPVEIRSGSLAGLRGKVLRSASGQRFVVQVNFIQQGASILVEGLDLEVVKA